jgi:hemerythrin
MSLIEWNDDLLTNIPHIDDEHKNLVLLLNKLHHAVSQGKGQEAINPVLIELTRYAQTHFKHEEDYMQERNYPEFEAHRKEHLEFMEKVKDFEKQYKNGEISTLVPIIIFIIGWIMQHVSQVDKKLEGI